MHVKLKTAFICFALSLLVGSGACGQEHSRVGDAPHIASASAAKGWKEVSTSGIALQFPDTWKLINLSKDTIDKAIDLVLGQDPKNADLRKQVIASAKQGTFKLFAFETATLGTSFATNCNVVALDIQSSVTLEQEATATVTQIKSIVAAGTQPSVKYISLKAGKAAIIRSEFKLNKPGAPPVVGLSYLIVKNAKLVEVTFSAPVKEETSIQNFANKVMNTFRFTN